MSATRGSMTANSPIYCTTSCTGWTFPSGCSTSCVQRFTDVCIQHNAPQYMTDCCIHTSDIARRQHLRSAGCCQLFVPRHRRSMFGRRAFNSLWLAWRPGTRYQTIFEIRRTLLTVFVVTWKLFYCRFTSVYSALEALWLCTIEIYYRRWHLCTAYRGVGPILVPRLHWK